MEAKVDSQECKWGFLRETRKMAEKYPIDKDTGICRTGLEDYLAVIFPDIKPDEWLHDKSLKETNPLQKVTVRPDYRCESMKLIVEFDGTGHFVNEETLRKDKRKDRLYSDRGYKVVRIPYFIQLTNAVVKKMFGQDVSEPLFPDSVPSMGPKGKNMPSICCDDGISRMANDFLMYPQQLLVNYRGLRDLADNKTGLSRLVKKIGEVISESYYEQMFVDVGVVDSLGQNMKTSPDFSFLELSGVDSEYDVYLKYRKSLCEPNETVTLKSIEKFGLTIPYTFVLLRKKSEEDDKSYRCFQFKGDVHIGTNQEGRIRNATCRNQDEVEDEIRILIFRIESGLIH